MDDWIKEKAIKAYEEQERADKRALKLFFRQRIREIVGIEMGHVGNRAVYRLGDYEFQVVDRCGCFPVRPAHAALRVCHTCPHRSGDEGWWMSTILENTADWGKFILSREKHMDRCKELAKAQPPVQPPKKKGFWQR